MKTRFPYLIIILLLLVALFYKECESAKVDPPSQSISFEEAKSLQNEFLKTRSPLLEKGLGFDDNRDFWFSLDTIKKYIKYVESEAKGQELKDLGLRMYFSAYPEPQENDEFPFSTVVIVPTSRNYSDGVQGFMPISPTDDNIEDIDALNYGTGGRPPNDL